MSSNLKLKLAALTALLLSAACIVLVFAFDPWTGLAVFAIAVVGGAIAVHFLPESDDNRSSDK